MASNNGRGPTRRAGFQFTDTIANGDSTQAILIAQDAIIDRLNAVVSILDDDIVAEYNTFIAVGNSKVNAVQQFATAELASTAGIIGPVNLGETTIATAYSDGDLALVVNNVDTLGTRGAIVRLLVLNSSSNVGSIQLVTLPASGNSITIVDLDVDFPIGSRVVNISGAVVSAGIAAIAKVDLKN